VHQPGFANYPIPGLCAGVWIGQDADGTVFDVDERITSQTRPCVVNDHVRIVYTAGARRLDLRISSGSAFLAAARLTPN
jgi:hypothetical protein